AATHLGEALIAAAEVLAETSGRQAAGPGHIVLISDLQEGSGLEPLQGFDWPRGIDLSVEALKPKRHNNAGLQLLTDAKELDTKAAAGIRVRVSNASDSRREQFKVGWAGADG